jgi:endo-1,4-beta-xylanase
VGSVALVAFSAIACSDGTPPSGPPGAVAGAAGASGNGGTASGGTPSAAGGGGASAGGGTAGANVAGGGAAGANAGGFGGGGNGGSSGMAGNGGTGGTGVVGTKFVGNITTRGQVRSDFLQFWDQLTPENEGKWGRIEGSRDNMNWDSMDSAYQFAKDNGIPFKAHTLVWGSQQPTWLNGLSAAEQREEVEEWIRLFCERYPEAEMIDVVNEPPPHTEPVYMNALGGAGESGWDWIVQSFTWAHQYCPNSILILNDFNTIEYEADNSRFINIVKALQAAGAPIDALGAQAHDAYQLPTATVKMYIDKMATETGLPIYISEYDINLAGDSEQEAIMMSQFEMFWDHPDVKGITFWGYVTGQTWKANTGLMSAQGQQRPAMTWLMDFMER